MGFLRRGGDGEAASLDEAVIEQLEGMGADLSRPRDTRFYLYTRDESGAMAAAHALEEQGFSLEVGNAAEEDVEYPFLVLASRDMVVSRESISEARAGFEGLAEQHGGVYDGWEAAAD
jgi:hypothetical protein